MGLHSCAKPLKGFRGSDGLIKFARSNDAYVDRPITVSCGQCIFCRLERSRQWAVRMIHEAEINKQEGKESSFLTLTYDNEHLPSDGGIDYEHWRSFYKRCSAKGLSFRYFHCGEYGDKYLRPHYHAAIFGTNWDSDREPVDGDTGLYCSPTLTELWGKGNVMIGDLTFESAAYIARYVTKKVTGKGAEAENAIGFKPYERVDASTGEVLEVRPEYCTMSRRPGIGQRWIERYHTDVYPRDYVSVRGIKCKPPKYYDRWLEKNNPELFEYIKRERRLRNDEEQYLYTEDEIRILGKGMDVRDKDERREYAKELEMKHFSRDYEK